MNYLTNVFSAGIQGLTEYLPISSSGHLALIRLLTTSYEEPLVYDIFLHAGSLLAIIIFFRKIIIKSGLKLLPQLTSSVLPAAVVGVVIYQYFQSIFESAQFLGFSFIITSLFMFIFSSLPSGKTPLEKVNLKQALVTGLFQAVAIIPGISRSGSTLLGNKVARLDDNAVFTFAFLMSIPAISGAIVLVIKDSPTLTPEYLTSGVIGLVISFFVSLVSIAILRFLLKSKKLEVFAWYTLVIGSACLGLFL